MIRPMCLYPTVAPYPTHLLPSQTPLPPQQATGSPVPAIARSPKRQLTTTPIYNAGYHLGRAAGRRRRR
jgi:hypothetical protein